MSEPETAAVDAATGQKSPAVRGKKRRREKAVEGNQECEVSPETKKVLSALLGCVSSSHLTLSAPLQVKRWRNKQRVLVFCARGVTFR